ncbi:2-amino-4-hydroxy-6-hydroxymethyldihydropteridine diphosphokinase [Fuerstiella marisgermanici]|uniref:2-amino-4-hydroxy-6-hydroxymethyldihydropteridine pyrophosphokinase n=1 Tax=Fuerstiella marisgermanici TaxID=1891926 RepID=A0A1P8WRP2_9PLAN|nr:2-amino-4-hydroxy-6-hydroxymethyldihydropteridine diphosphokinase [Fuerstiella marisgermanici]APZ96720.1 Bifunctional folate synthesis protein [Fuerstiella marisgermanici]
MALTAIALGGNVGDTAERFEAAFAQIESLGNTVAKRSTFVGTPPMGESAGDPFLNAAALVETALPPQQFLQQLHQVEANLGRERSVHWGPRTLDLDLLLYDQQVIDSDAAVVPHPALWQRRFVLEPLREIASDWVHPVLQETIDQLFCRIDQRPLRFEIDGANVDPTRLDDLCHWCGQEFDRGDVSLTIAKAAVPPDNLFARIIVRDSGVVEPNRTQPRPHDSRTIEIAAAHAADATKLRTALNDIITAALG